MRYFVHVARKTLDRPSKTKKSILGFYREYTHVWGERKIKMPTSSQSLFRVLIAVHWVTTYTWPKKHSIDRQQQYTILTNPRYTYVRVGSKLSVNNPPPF